MPDEYKPKSLASEDFKPKLNISDGHSSCASKPRSQNLSFALDPGTSYEVFRNNTTAVEVIVKDVSKGKKKITSIDSPSIVVNHLQGDYNKMRRELNVANAAVDGTRKQYQAVIRELKKHLDTANQRELDTQTKNLVLQLENEKLKGLLKSKTNLLNKVTKELVNMKRLMKFVIKSICYVPQNNDNITCSTDPEYDEFENELQKDMKPKFAVNMFDAMCTFDSSVSKEVKNSFDKKQT